MVIDAISTAITSLFDLLLMPFGSHAGVALAVASLACGAAVMGIFRATSDQAGLRRLRNRFQAHVLEILIYQDDPVLILKALAGALRAQLAALRLMRVALPAAAALVAIVFVQLDARFARSSLRAGDTAVVTVTYGAEVDVLRDAPWLAASEGATVDSLLVRVPARREANWRVRVNRSGAPVVRLGVRDRAYRFSLAAKPGTGLVGHVRSRSPMDALLHPGLPRLREDAPIERVAVRYPAAEHALFGWRTSWLWVFVFWSLVGALGSKWLFRVE